MRSYTDPTDPKPEAIQGKDTIIGGRWDSRPVDTWKPEDGLHETALGKQGVPLQRLQCVSTTALKNGGGRCTQPPEAGYSMCRHHGGSARHPVKGSPTRYERALYGRLAERFQENMADEAMLDHRPALALMDSVAEELLVRAKERDTPKWRKAAVDLMDELDAAMRTGEAAAFNAAVAALGKHIRSGASRDMAMLEATEVVERRQVRAESVRRLQLKAESTITERMMASALYAVAEAMLREIPIDLRPRVLDAFDHAILALGPVTPAHRVHGG